jgi:precorrin-2 dehydrogenase/sirohydrochlorin ferrochelatase
MKYFPVLLDLAGKTCVVVGGGRVAERKVQGLRKAGAEVRVIGPKVTAALARLQAGGKIGCRLRPFRLGDLRGAFLAIAATDDRTVNERVFQQALAMKIPVNVVDDPAHSTFIVPSLVRQGDLLLAISTSGRSPALARMLRQKMEREIGPEYGFLLKMLAAARRKVLPMGLGPKRNQALFRRLVREDLLALIRTRDWKGLDERLVKNLGSGFTLRELRLKGK